MTDERPRGPQYGETWVYESIVGAVPGVDLSPTAAIALQVGVFEAAILGLAWYYDLWSAALAGTVAVGVAGAGSVAMLAIGGRIRAADAPAPYRRLLFGSSIEVVMSVVAFVALLTYLFVTDSGSSGPSLLESLFGARPPEPAVFVTLMVLWDLCYRIGTSWWAAVVGLWRSLRYEFDPETATALRRVDRLNVGFGLLQLALVPFVQHHPVLAFAVVGHVAAVTLVSVVAASLLRE